MLFSGNSGNSQSVSGAGATVAVATTFTTVAGTGCYCYCWSTSTTSYACASTLSTVGGTVGNGNGQILVGGTGTADPVALASIFSTVAGTVASVAEPEAASEAPASTFRTVGGTATALTLNTVGRTGTDARASFGIGISSGLDELLLKFKLVRAGFHNCCRMLSRALASSCSTP